MHALPIIARPWRSLRERTVCERGARIALAALSTAVIGAGTAAAQAPTALRRPDGATRGMLTIGVGVEPALVFTIGYLHPVGRASRGAVTDPRIGVRLELPTTVLRNAAWRLDLLGTATAGRGRGWSVPATGAVYVAHGRNRAGSMLGLGTELRAAPGRYGPNGAIALDLGWQATLLTYVRHSDASRATFGDRYGAGRDGASGVTGPVDGWYSLTSSRWRLGLAGSRAASPSSVLQFATGALVVAPQRQGVMLGFDLGQLPFYAEAGVSVGW
jgi:hypothetical protein